MPHPAGPSHQALATGLAVWTGLMGVAWSLAGSPRRALLSGVLLGAVVLAVATRPAIRQVFGAGQRSTRWAVGLSAVLLLAAQLGELDRELYPYVSWNMYTEPHYGAPIAWLETAAVGCDGSTRSFRVSEAMPRTSTQMVSALSRELDIFTLGAVPRDTAAWPEATAIARRIGLAYQAVAQRPVCGMAVLVGHVPPGTPWAEARRRPVEVMHVPLAGQ